MIRLLSAAFKDCVDPDDPRIRAVRLGQLKLAARNSHASLKQVPLMAAAIAGGLSLWADWRLMLGWYVAMVAASTAMHFVLKPYLGELDAARLKPLTLRFASVNLMQMVVFSSVAPLAWPEAPLGQALVQLVLAATMASVASMTGPSRAIFVSDITPPALAAIVTPLALDGIAGAPFALLSTLFAVMMVDNARGPYELAEKALSLNDANTALIEELRAANKAKSEFLANMSHELRTPLNAILGFSEVMKDEVLGPIGTKTYKGYAADIHGSGVHLLSLVNDILDLARIEAGKLELVDEVSPVDGIVETSLRLFRVQAENAGVALIADVTPGIFVRWDVRAAKQIAINLMSNALKFTPSGGSITLSAHPTADGGCAISVTDTGCGIAPEYHQKIFENFGQGRHDVAQEDASTGLGLAIVHGLVELHGAKLALKSAVGEGTTITVLVPPDRTSLPVPEERRTDGGAYERAA